MARRGASIFGRKQFTKVKRAQTSFTAGELTGTLRGRKDTQLYFAGCERLTNMIVRPQGGTLVRPGLRHMANLHELTSTPGVRLIDFIFRQDQRYVVCLFHARMRVYRLSDLVQVSDTPAPWSGANLPFIDWVQLYDVLLIVHPDYRMREIARGPGEVWTISEFEFECPPQHKMWPDRGTKLWPSAKDGPGVTMMAVEGDNNDVFLPSHVGQMWTYKEKRFRITSYVSPIEVVVDVYDIFPDDDPTPLWTQQVNGGPNGYFNSIAYFQDRLWLGGTRELPFRLWASRTAAPYDFQIQGVDDDDPISLPLSTGRADAILHLVPGSGGLEVYTAGGEGFIPGVSDQPITPKTISWKPQTEYGSRKEVKPIRMDAQTIFAQRDGGALREFVYTDTQRSYEAPPLTIRAAHLVDDPVALCAVAGGFGIQADFMLTLNRDGTGAIMSSQRQEEVRAWTDLSSQMQLLDCVTVGGTVYMATLNETDGKTSLGYLDPAAIFDGQVDKTAVDGDADVYWTGFFHLANRKVGLWAAKLDEPFYWRGTIKVDADGAIVTPPYYKIKVGLEVDVLLWPMPPELESDSILGMAIRPVRAHILYKSGAAIRLNGQVIPDRPFNDVPNTAPRVETKIGRVHLAGWSRDGRGAVRVTREGPHPFEVLELAVDYGVGGG
jgi:hypothetical protein